MKEPWRNPVHPDLVLRELRTPDAHHMQKSGFGESVGKASRTVQDSAN